MRMHIAHQKQDFKKMQLFLQLDIAWLWHSHREQFSHDYSNVTNSNHKECNCYVHVMLHWITLTSHCVILSYATFSGDTWLHSSRVYCIPNIFGWPKDNFSMNFAHKNMFKGNLDCKQMISQWVSIYYCQFTPSFITFPLIFATSRWTLYFYYGKKQILSAMSIFHIVMGKKCHVV